MSTGDDKVLKFPIRHAGKAADRFDVVLPERFAGTVTEPAVTHPALQAIAKRIVSALGDDRPGSWNQDVSRTADYLIEAFGSPEAAALKARRLEKNSDLPYFARAVRVEIERRAARKT